MRLIPHASRFAGTLFGCVCTLAALLVPVLLFPGDDDAARSPIVRALTGVRKDRIPPEEEDQVMAGYYEDLFSFSSRTISTNRLITGKWATNWSKDEPILVNDQDDTRLHSFLYYEMKPNLNRKEFDGQLITNRFGMADREYSRDRPEGVRRVAFIGDSLTRGLGASFGKNFESLLEDRINGLHPAPDVAHYEFLNFAVRGYRITQLLWVLETRAADFHPQADIVVFTDLTAFRKWGDHIVQLVHDGIDLHYSYLKELATRAALRPDDDPQTFDAKLAPFRDEVVRWTLQTMRASAKEQGADVIVILVPPVVEASLIREAFASVKTLVESLDIPVVDASDTFAGIDNLDPYRISAANPHPTDPGHALLAERIYARLRENPRAWTIVTGAPAPKP